MKKILFLTLFLFFWSIMPICLAADTTTTTPAPPIADNIKQFVADSITVNINTPGSPYDPLVTISAKTYTITIIDYKTYENGMGYSIRIVKDFAVLYTMPNPISSNTPTSFTTEVVKDSTTPTIISGSIKLLSTHSSITPCPALLPNLPTLYTCTTSVIYSATFTPVFMEHRTEALGLIFSDSTAQLTFNPQFGAFLKYEFAGNLRISTNAVLLLVGDTADIILTEQTEITDTETILFMTDYMPWFIGGGIVIVAIVIIFFVIKRKPKIH